MRRAPIERLLHALYTADLHSLDLTQFLLELERAFRSPVIALHIHDPAHGRGKLNLAFGAPPELPERYEELAPEHLWLQRGASRLLAEGVVDDRELATEHELQSSRFYAELLAPAGIRHGMAFCLHHNRTGHVTVLSLNRGRRAGSYSHEESKLAKTLLPHLRNVYALHQRLSWADSLAQGLRQALDRMSEAVVLLDGHGRTVYANEAATRVAGAGGALRIDQGIPHATWKPDERPLSQLIAQACSADAVEPCTLRLHDARGRIASVVKACPVPPAVASSWSETGIRAMLFVRDAVQPRPGPTNLVATWGFTPSEAELAWGLMSGYSLKELALAGRVSKNTVRTQLRALFAKTGTGRQADLVRVLLQLTPN